MHINYVPSLHLPHLVLTDGTTYQLMIKHPTQPVIFLAPPITDAGLVTAVPGPVLCTHKPLGLAVALCAWDNLFDILTPAELATTFQAQTASHRRVSTRLQRH